MKKELIFSSILFLLSLISFAYANEEQTSPDLMNIPEQLGTAMGIGTFAAGIICSVVLVFIFIFPLEYLLRGRSQWASLIVGIGLMSFEVAIGWMPVYVIILLVLIVAVLIAFRTKGGYT